MGELRLFNISDYDNKLLLLRRKRRSYLITLLKYLTYRQPYIDELVCLKHILNLLDKHNLPYSKNEVRRCLKEYYNKELHLSCQRTDLLKNAITRTTYWSQGVKTQKMV